MMAPNEEYLADGLYVSFDGSGFTLRAPRDRGDHWVYLEPFTYRMFVEYANRCHEQAVRATVRHD